MPNAVDLVFTIIVFIIGALLDYFVLWPYLLRKLSNGERDARMQVYSIIMAWLWLATIFVAVRWWMLARPWTALWLSPPHGWRLLASMLAVLAAAALWLTQTRALSRLSAEKRAALRQRSGHLLALTPHTAAEYRWFIFVSVTAGICEELLYRGFLVWVLQQWVGLEWAAAISVIMFGAGHAYQGKDVVRPTVAGVVLQGIALLTRSILPGILVHAMLDAMSGTSGYMLLRASAGIPEPTSSSELFATQTGHKL
jgi:membrane protease YdiL (CAAX protease family)